MNTRELTKFIQAADVADLAPLITGRHGITLNKL